ncbi:C40 family peptidase [Mariniflexile jejuense]|uniref:C40 family peptidase n=1 Tax=Mariniflexile jejuense TaxID=1173582 RepID=A0ABW3JNT9_9FLAO
MRNIIILLLIAISFSSCKSSKAIVVKKSTSKKVVSQPKTVVSATKTTSKVSSKKGNDDSTENDSVEFSKAISIVDYAKQFSGVKYKFGGATKDGMDCSGLVFESFRAFDIILPRISRDMAKQGEKITLKNTQEGDLLFFKTMNRRNDISHVGLVVSAENGDIEFIHSTTRAGVIVSKLSESYWDNAFVEARRML